MWKNLKKFIYDNCFQCICGVIALGIVLLGLCYTYKVFVKENVDTSKKIISVENQVNLNQYKNGTKVTQTFETKEPLHFFEIKMETKDLDSKLDDRIYVKLIKGKKVVKDWKITSADIINDHVRFDLSDKKDLKGKFCIQLSFAGKATDNHISIYESTDNLYNAGTLMVDNIPQSGDLAFSVYGGNNHFLYKMYFILVIVLILGGILCWRALKLNVKQEKIALFLTIFLGICHMFLMPTYSTPDERAHIATTYYYSNVLMGTEALDKDENVLVRNEDLKLNIEQMRPTLGTYALINDNFFKLSQDNEMVSMGRSYMSIPFWGYAPQILGLTVARILNLGNILTFFSAQLMALIFYALCVWQAIKKIPFGKSTMMIIALYPMTLESAGSFSYDVVVNGLSFVFIGYTFYLAYEKNKVETRDWVYLGALMFLMAPVKVIYVILGALCLIIPKEKINGKKWGIGTTIISGLLSCILLRLSSVFRLSGVSSTVERHTTMTDTYTIPYILNHIPSVIKILYNTLRTMVDAILEPLFGQRLGVWDITIPFFISFFAVILLIMSTIVQENEKVMIKNWHRCLMMGISIVILGEITLAMMLDFTPITDTVVRGIQGRYLLPFLPIFVYSFRNSIIVTKKSLDKYFVASVYILNYFTLWRIFETVVVR